MNSPIPPTDRPAWRVAADHAAATFLTGLLFLLPFILTLMILDWLARQVAAIFGPETLIGSVLTSGGTLIFGDAAIGFWLLLAFVVVGIWAVGFTFGERARRIIDRRLDSFIDRIPILRNIYKPVAQIVRMMGVKDENDLAKMRVVACRFGVNGADVLALLASTAPVLVGDEERLIVYLPSAPIPMTGGLVLVPASSIIEVTGVTVDDLMKLYVSLGTLTPPTMRVAKPKLFKA